MISENCQREDEPSCDEQTELEQPGHEASSEDVADHDADEPDSKEDGQEEAADEPAVESLQSDGEHEDLPSRRQSYSSDRRTSLRTEALIHAAARAVVAKIETRDGKSRSSAGSVGQELDGSSAIDGAHHDDFESSYDADPSENGSRRDSSESMVHHTPQHHGHSSAMKVVTAAPITNSDEDDVFSDNHSARSSLSGLLWWVASQRRRDGEVSPLRMFTTARASPAPGPRASPACLSSRNSPSTRKRRLVLCLLPATPPACLSAHRRASVLSRCRHQPHPCTLARLRARTRRSDRMVEPPFRPSLASEARRCRPSSPPRAEPLRASSRARRRLWCSYTSPYFRCSGCGAML